MLNLMVRSIPIEANFSGMVENRGRGCGHDWSKKQIRCRGMKFFYDNFFYKNIQNIKNIIKY